MTLRKEELRLRTACPVPEGMREEAERVLARAAAEFSPRCAALRLPVFCGNTVAGVTLTGRASELLANCGEAYLTAATVGFLPEERTGFGAVYTDAVGNAALSLYTDALEERLGREAAAEGLFLTPRLAPGGDGFPLAAVQDLLTALDAPRRIGVHANPYGALLPVKSVVYLLGLTKTERACGGTCALCGRAGCPARRKQ